jgi:hypothetical protein
MTEPPDQPPASPPEDGGSPLRAPSLRVTAMLAAGMLAIGVAVGAAIGPAPGTSFAGVARLPLLLGSLAARASSSTAAQPPAVTPTATPSAAKSKAKAPASGSQAATETSAGEEESKPPTKKGATKSVSLPPITKIWLIELAGSGFSEARAQAASAPYITGQAIPQGALLSKWSGLDAGAFASDAALISSTPPQSLDTIIQPPCPEASAAECAAGTPGALSAADEFLKASLPTITSLSAYRESGLIVVTFGSVLVGSATGLPSGAATATLIAEPPAGVLLISPFVTAGSHPSTTFSPASPGQSLARLLHK